MKHYFSSLKGDTIKAIFLVCLAVGVVGMSYGSLAMAYGFPLWVPFVLSITVLAGASEFMFIGIVASGGNPLAAAAAGLLVNARHIPFGVTVRDLVGKRGELFGHVTAEVLDPGDYDTSDKVAYFLRWEVNARF